MERKYVVVDAEGNISFSANTESPEEFRAFRAAEKRAKELAKCDPGKVISIYELTGEVVVPLAEVESKRAHPIEHYK